jgi:magnesium transporter
MNVIVNDRTHYLELALLLAGMAAMSAALLGWTKQQGWW